MRRSVIDGGTPGCCCLAGRLYLWIRESDDMGEGLSLHPLSISRAFLPFPFADLIPAIYHKTQHFFTFQ